VARRKIGPQGQRSSPNEIRRSIIDSFIKRWRKEVGNDIYPAFRLIVPEKDRDRAMYGLKEMTLAKLLVRVMKIDKNSDDAHNLLHWKLPGIKASTAMAGDFAGRCFEVISKRPMRTTPGDMTIAEVNEQLDRLSVAQKEDNQLPIMQDFYNRMNADELMWLIRMILRQMKVGATEKTLFEIWHPDADNLFNISSSLRRVCWELYDPDFRLEGDSRGIHLMQCFQPQLAAFQMKSLEAMVAKMGATEDDPVFFVEEKLDGERMQMHMIEDDDNPGGKRFAFWSRKAKDYTYLYGNGFEAEDAALTQKLRDAFADGVRNIILDGEMITWDPEEEAVVPFGRLKTAALLEQKNPFGEGRRPLFRIFDCLYLNDVDLTRYTLRKRREALRKSINDVHRRFEVHEFEVKQHESDVENMLRHVVATSDIGLVSEGLVLKNPRSMYRLNDRNEDWIKVKPEYMTGFGEEFDCIVVGGYYGSGKRGGILSSFLCGLVVDEERHPPGSHPQKTYSFCKVGGGFSADDYAQVRHHTDGKWHTWDPKRPPTDVIELAGGDRQFERPDMWIYPADSVVLAVKAAQITGSDQFRQKLTLRFPRFKKLRTDKDWKSALKLSELIILKNKVEEEREEKKFKIDDERRKRNSKRRKRSMVIQGQENDLTTPYAGPATKVFDGMKFYIMTEARAPIKKSKAELEQIVKSNGGSVVASEKDESTIVIADGNLVKVASLKKNDRRNIVRPSWLLDCVRQAEIDVERSSYLLPYEPQHLFHTKAEDREGNTFDDHVDQYGDSYAQDVTPEGLLQLLNKMNADFEEDADAADIIDQLDDHGHETDEMPGFMFQGIKAYCEDVPEPTRRLFLFANGHIMPSVQDDSVTHVITGGDTESVRELRKTFSSRRKLPRLVTPGWVTDSWKEGTRLDEERKSRCIPCVLCSR
jgi:DNA ligase 4